MKKSKSLLEIAQNAKKASKRLRLIFEKDKNEALYQISHYLEKERSAILIANKRDLDDAVKKGMPPAMLDRLSLQENRLNAVISDVLNVAKLADPVGEIMEERMLPNGLILQKKRVAIGVLGVIYESRPNVTVDVATLALKTSNAVVLRGGKETLRTNVALILAIQKALTKTVIPSDSVQLIQSKSRLLIKQLLKLDSYVDMIIPRGGSALHRLCIEESTIPVITGGIGICHLFVDESADLEKAIGVIVNAKTQRPSVCNALDTLLVHKKIAKQFLPLVVTALQTKNVSFRLDDSSWDILRPNESTAFKRANKTDWMTEWLSLTLGVKIVDTLQDAIDHIQTFSTSHSDGILTESSQNAEAFVQAIDSAAVYVNASTRFTDGGQFGLGAEVAVSTQKLHARGPMGLHELTTYKWIGKGNYHIRS